MPNMELDDALDGDLLAAWIEEAGTTGTPAVSEAAARALLVASLDAYRRVRDEYVTEADIIPRRYTDATLNSPLMRTWALTIARNWLRPAPIKTGPSLILSGPPGRGKTHEVYAARRAFYNIGIPVSWTITTAADLNGSLRKFDGTDAVDYARCAILVVDDLGAGGHTTFNDDNLYRIVNYRYENELPTIVTSNLSWPKLAALIGERTSSRLFEMCNLAVWTDADKDWRKP